MLAGWLLKVGSFLWATSTCNYSFSFDIGGDSLYFGVALSMSDGVCGLPCQVSVYRNVPMCM